MQLPHCELYCDHQQSLRQKMVSKRRNMFQKNKTQETTKNEDCVERCDQPTMVAPTHNMNDGREERVARYKEERRRQLAAQFGSRSPGAGPLPEPRSTRASRLRSQALVESARTQTRPIQQHHPAPDVNKHEDENHCNGDVSNKKEKDKSHKRKSYLNRSLTAEPVNSTSSLGERRRQNGSLGGVGGAARTTPSTALGSSSSPVPRSAQLVKRHSATAVHNSSPQQSSSSGSVTPVSKRADRGSTPDSDGSGSNSRIPRKISSPQVFNPILSPNHRTQPNALPQRVLAKSNSSVEPSPVRLSSLPSSPARHPPHSILKKSSLDETGALQQPVSILKRKTSQEDGCGRSGSPVRFSPSVVERKGRGILKKHRSLDDSRRSPDSLHHSQNGVEECRPILKSQQRRCSLEEVVKGPIGGVEPQGILKRKTSRDEVVGEPAGVVTEQPQGILKRKSSPNHISVAESVIRSAAESLHDLDHVRPILKKKEEQAQEMVHVQDIPRPILKKKSSSEEEEHPVKPILKPPKKEEDAFSDSSCSGNGVASGGMDSPTKRQSLSDQRSILKYCSESEVVSQPSPPGSPLNAALRGRPSPPPSPLDNPTRREAVVGGYDDISPSSQSLLGAALRTRTSPPPSHLDNLNRRQPTGGLCFEEASSPPSPLLPPLAAALRHRTSPPPLHLDNLTRRQAWSPDAIPSTPIGVTLRNRSSSPPPPSSPSVGLDADDITSSTSPLPGPLAQVLKNRTSPPPPYFDNLTRRHSSTFGRAPNTDSSPSSPPPSGVILRTRTSPPPPYVDSHTRRQPIPSSGTDEVSPPTTPLRPRTSLSPSLGDNLTRILPTPVVMRNKSSLLPGADQTRRRTLDPTVMSRRPKSPLALDMTRPRPLSVAERIYNLESFLTIEGEVAGSAPRRSASSAGSTAHSRMEGRSNDEIAGLRRSGSVSEKASMWTKLQQEKQTEAAAQRKVNKGIRSRNKVDSGRFNTQPVTQCEVEQAKRNNTLDCVDEEDPSRLSVIERVKLFSLNGHVSVSPAGSASGLDGGTTKGAATSLAAIQRAQSSSIVAGLMKNLVQKSTGSVPKLVPRSKVSPDSESGGGDDQVGCDMAETTPPPFERRGTISSASSSEEEEDSSGGEDEGSSMSEEGIAGGQRRHSSKEDDSLKLSLTVGDEETEEATTTTEGESSSSGGREIRSIMTNGTRGSKKMLRCGEVTAIRRCATQPMPPASHHIHHNRHHVQHHVHQDEPDEPQPPPTTIAQRLAALQKSGQSDWRKRVTKSSTEADLPLVTNNANNVNKNNALAERVGKLESAAQGWKSRVVTSDTHQFTVAGRMAVTSPAQPLPVGSQASRTPLPQIFNSASTACIPPRPTATSAPQAFVRSTSVPDNDKSNDVIIDGPKVTIPELCDEEFSSFFSTPRTTLLQATSEINDVDFEHITVQNSQLLVHKKNVRIQRKHRSANPVKALARRSDLRTEYVEVRSATTMGSAATARELKSKLNNDKSLRNSGLAAEALAGLASKEDLKSVMLRKAADSPRPWAVSQWQHPLLLRVKGRRHAITTVVRPHYSTINQGDTFILVTQNQVFHWIGEYCNVIEKCRGSEIAQEIQSRKDLGCLQASHVVTLVGNGYSDRHAQFWHLLSLPEDKLQSYRGKPAGHPDEDEVYEAALAETYTVYQLTDNQLVPVQSYWGRMPKIDVLQSSKVLVFDFGSEVFVWGGKNTELCEKKLGTQLAKELAKGRKAVWHPTGIDWLDIEMEGETRSDWCIVCKVTQHMEPVLFREKFLNWPSVDISTNNHNSIDKQVDGVFEVYPCNMNEMVKWTPPPPDFVLEGTHLGRGQIYFDTETRRHFEIVTESIKTWRVEDYRLVEVNKSSVGHFNETDSYKIKWDYRVNVTGRELSGKISRHGKRQVGRERVATLLWQGVSAPALERGAAAALVGGTTATITTSANADEGSAEGGATIVLRQGYEPPALKAALPGPLVIHQPRDPTSTTHLYLVLGDVEGEATLQQVQAQPFVQHLRSRASVWLLDTTNGHSYLWHGAQTQPKNRQIALNAVNHLKDTNPPELGLGDGVSIVIEEIYEGKEPHTFVPDIEENRASYCSLLDKSWDYGDQGCMRMFQLSSMLGEFKATPIISVTYHPDVNTPYPYTQQELYAISQPGIVLVDGGPCGGLWLWQGWCDTGVFDRGGSVWLRHQAERRAAMTSALQYWSATRPQHDSSSVAVRLVYAGLEPVEFTTLFPTWTRNEEAAEFNRKEGHSDGVMENVQDELSKLNKCNYPPSILLQHPLPPGVDPTRLELYLDQHHFKELLGVSQEEFRELPHWKRTKLKKASGLF